MKLRERRPGRASSTSNGNERQRLMGASGGQRGGHGDLKPLAPGPATGRVLVSLDRP